MIIYSFRPLDCLRAPQPCLHLHSTLERAVTWLNQEIEALQRFVQEMCLGNGCVHQKRGSVVLGCMQEKRSLRRKIGVVHITYI